MSHRSNHPYPADICLMLRSHAEEQWLNRQVLPVVRQLEQPESIPDDQRGAALAYLELLWIDACLRAAETEAARRELGRARRQARADPPFQTEARQLHAVVRRLRQRVSRRVARLISPPWTPRAHQHAVL